VKLDIEGNEVQRTESKVDDKLNNLGEDCKTKKASQIKIIAIVLVLIALLIGYWLMAPGFDEIPTTTTPDGIEASTTPIPTPDNNITNSIGMELVLIPAGKFKMGSPSGEVGRYRNEIPMHYVTIEKAYYLGKYEVTQKQWSEVMGDNPSNFNGDDLPVEGVSWYDVQDFVNKLNEREGTDKYRLPSESEWEYAIRAGTNTQYSFGDNASDLEDYAWYSYNSGKKTNPVGQKQPNPWGLYNMHGNVFEWVQDKWHNDYYGAPLFGQAWESGSESYRVVRGGNWYFSAGGCRSASRNYFPSDVRINSVGFRLLQEI